MVYLPDYVEYQHVPAPPLRSLFPMASDDALDLLSKMFTYDPNARISAQQALEHRYFSSAPLPTVPEKLPRPAPKKESKASDVDSQDGPTVLSPPRKSRRIMPGRDGFEGNSLQEDKFDDNAGNFRQTVADNTGKNGPAPMSLDFSLFGLKPPNRPTITSADRSHLKRKLDLEFGNQND